MKRLLNVFWVCIISLCILSLSCVIASATNNQSIDTEDAFQDGWQEGYDIGSDEGYSKGYDEGYNDGLEESIYKYNSDTYDEDSNESHNLNKEDLIIILALFLFMAVIAIIVLADKYKYMKSNYDRVRKCCCFRERYITQNEEQAILDHVGIFNQALVPDISFLITTQDRTECINFYKEYRLWLLEKYMDRCFSFKERYINPFSSNEKKRYNINDFYDIYGNGSTQVLFLALTFCDFCDSALAYHDHDMLAAHKMYLGAAKILNIIGFDVEPTIKHEELIIQKLNDERKIK